MPSRSATSRIGLVGARARPRGRSSLKRRSALQRPLACGHGVHARSSSSCGKYLITQSTGFGAAWPRPQIEASRITCDRSASSGRSHLRLRRSAPRPWRCRRGRACTGRRTRARRSASGCAPRRRRVSWSDSTITAAEPMKQPCGCSVSKSSGRSASRRRQDAARRAAGQVAVEARARRACRRSTRRSARAP